jgi:DNA polymerase III subunit alpha
MSKYALLHAHSMYSLLDGLSKPTKMAARCEELGLAGLAVTDHASSSGVPAFIEAMTKKKQKWISGNEFNLSPLDCTIKAADNRKCSHLVVLAKNKAGWKRLIRMTSESNKAENYYYRPRLDLSKLGNFTDGNLVSFSGHPGSDLANIIFQDLTAYRARTYEEAKALVRPDWLKASTNLAYKYQDIFGKGNFFLEIQLIDAANLPAAKIVAEALRYVSKKTSIPCVATADAHYPSREDAYDQRILLCSAMNTSLQKIQVKLDADEDVMLGAFFKSTNYYIPSYDEMAALHTEEELANTVLIADMCENYDIFGKPKLPQFVCPDGMTPDEYLRHLAREGWKSKVKAFNKDEKVYGERVKEELGVMLEAGLSSYMLIVHDYLQAARGRGELLGYGRGSVGGSLLAYLLDITQVDPIVFNLMFERFYNAGRNTKDKVSLPDIDSDFEISKRGDTIEYIRNKYGRQNVAQVCTFGRLQGRGVLKEVLRAHEACSFLEMNEITAPIPDETKIAEDLQAVREAGGEPSIVRWALENESKALKQWCWLDDDGNCQGPFAKLFEQAIRLEGVLKTQGRHAAAVVISPDNLEEEVPMVRGASNDDLVVGIEYETAEKMGLVKFDILGVAALDKLHRIQNMLRDIE